MYIIVRYMYHKLLCCFLLLVLLNGCGTFIYASSESGKNYSKVEDIIEPINKIRSRGVFCGNKYYKAVNPVVWNEKLADASLEHSLDMAENGFIGHNGSDGSDPGDRLLRVGYTWNEYAENVGQGYKSSEEAVSAWLKSKKHCENIMNPRLKEVGASYARNKNLRTYWTLILGRSNR